MKTALPQTHTVMGCNFEWEGFTRSRDWAPREAGFAKAILTVAPTILLAQEVDRHSAGRIAYRAGEHMSYHRAQGVRGNGLNAVFWDSRVWRQDGKEIDVLLPSFGQMARTLIAVPLENVKTGEKVTAGSSHLANTGATDLDDGVSPLYAQTEQAREIVYQLRGRRRVILSLDSNNKTNLLGGRRLLVKNGYALAGHGIDVFATLPGVQLVAKPTRQAVPSDHKYAEVCRITTNTGSEL